ncbi:hypothetical protein NO1_0391 [Candidatus Termititenax aidoneus]|uniref:Uncharacterized protein n=1 Tax=Termititenax aidoneus TaxID=2218524 RepID=A0A388T9Q0_TERA1|nr:hypothetical protein NO1_0391 [Candidatus Termititenax aidoneus]
MRKAARRSQQAWLLQLARWLSLSKPPYALQLQQARRLQLLESWELLGRPGLRELRQAQHALR